MIGRTSAAARPHRVVMVAYPGAQVLDVVGPLEVFSRADRWFREELGRNERTYETEVVAASAGPLAMSQSLQLVAERSWREVEACDTLLVAGGIGVAADVENLGAVHGPAPFGGKSLSPQHRPGMVNGGLRSPFSSLPFMGRDSRRAAAAGWGSAMTAPAPRTYPQSPTLAASRPVPPHEGEGG